MVHCNKPTGRVADDSLRADEAATAAVNGSLTYAAVPAAESGFHIKAHVLAGAVAIENVAAPIAAAVHSGATANGSYTADTAAAIGDNAASAAVPAAGAPPEPANGKAVSGGVGGVADGSAGQPQGASLQDQPADSRSVDAGKVHEKASSKKASRQQAVNTRPGPGHQSSPCQHSSSSSSSSDDSDSSSTTSSRSSRPGSSNSPRRSNEHSGNLRDMQSIRERRSGSRNGNCSQTQSRGRCMSRSSGRHVDRSRGRGRSYNRSRSSRRGRSYSRCRSRRAHRNRDRDYSCTSSRSRSLSWFTYQRRARRYNRSRSHSRYTNRGRSRAQQRCRTSSNSTEQSRSVSRDRRRSRSSSRQHGSARHSGRDCSSLERHDARRQSRHNHSRSRSRHKVQGSGRHAGRVRSQDRLHDRRAAPREYTNWDSRRSWQLLARQWDRQQDRGHNAAWVDSKNSRTERAQLAGLQAIGRHQGAERSSGGAGDRDQGRDGTGCSARLQAPQRDSPAGHSYFCNRQLADGHAVKPSSTQQGVQTDLNGQHARHQDGNKQGDGGLVDSRPSADEQRLGKQAASRCQQQVQQEGHAVEAPQHRRWRTNSLCDQPAQARAWKFEDVECEDIVDIQPAGQQKEHKQQKLYGSIEMHSKQQKQYNQPCSIAAVHSGTQKHAIQPQQQGLQHQQHQQKTPSSAAYAQPTDKQKECKHWKPEGSKLMQDKQHNQPSRAPVALSGAHQQAVQQPRQQDVHQQQCQQHQQVVVSATARANWQQQPQQHPQLPQEPLPQEPQHDIRVAGLAAEVTSDHRHQVHETRNNSADQSNAQHTRAQQSVQDVGKSVYERLDGHQQWQQETYWQQQEEQQPPRRQQHERHQDEQQQQQQQEEGQDEPQLQEQQQQEQQQQVEHHQAFPYAKPRKQLTPSRTQPAATAPDGSTSLLPQAGSPAISRTSTKRGLVIKIGRQTPLPTIQSPAAASAAAPLQGAAQAAPPMSPTHCAAGEGGKTHASPMMPAASAGAKPEHPSFSEEGRQPLHKVQQHLLQSHRLQQQQWPKPEWQQQQQQQQSQHQKLAQHRQQAQQWQRQQLHLVKQQRPSGSYQQQLPVWQQQQQQEQQQQTGHTACKWAPAATAAAAQPLLPGGQPSVPVATACGKQQLRAQQQAVAVNMQAQQPVSPVTRTAVATRDRWQSPVAHPAAAAVGRQAAVWQAQKLLSPVAHAAHAARDKRPLPAANRAAAAVDMQAAVRQAEQLVKEAERTCQQGLQEVMTAYQQLHSSREQLAKAVQCCRDLEEWWFSIIYVGNPQTEGCHHNWQGPCRLEELEELFPTGVVDGQFVMVSHVELSNPPPTYEEERCFVQSSLAEALLWADEWAQHQQQEAADLVPAAEQAQQSLVEALGQLRQHAQQLALAKAFLQTADIKCSCWKWINGPRHISCTLLTWQQLQDQLAAGHITDPSAATVTQAGAFSNHTTLQSLLERLAAAQEVVACLQRFGLPDSATILSELPSFDDATDCWQFIGHSAGRLVSINQLRYWLECIDKLQLVRHFADSNRLVWLLDLVMLPAVDHEYADMRDPAAVASSQYKQQQVQGSYEQSQQQLWRQQQQQEEVQNKVQQQTAGQAPQQARAAQAYPQSQQQQHVPMSPVQQQQQYQDAGGHLDHPGLKQPGQLQSANVHAAAAKRGTTTVFVAATAHPVSAASILEQQQQLQQLVEAPPAPPTPPVGEPHGAAETAELTATTDESQPEQQATELAEPVPMLQGLNHAPCSIIASVFPAEATPFVWPSMDTRARKLLHRVFLTRKMKPAVLPQSDEQFSAARLEDVDYPQPEGYQQWLEQTAHQAAKLKAASVAQQQQQQLVVGNSSQAVFKPSEQQMGAQGADSDAATAARQMPESGDKANAAAAVDNDAETALVAAAAAAATAASSVQQQRHCRKRTRREHNALSKGKAQVAVTNSLQSEAVNDLYLATLDPETKAAIKEAMFGFRKSRRSGLLSAQAAPAAAPEQIVQLQQQQQQQDMSKPNKWRTSKQLSDVSADNTATAAAEATAEAATSSSRACSRSGTPGGPDIALKPEQAVAESGKDKSAVAAGSADAGYMEQQMAALADVEVDDEMRAAVQAAMFGLHSNKRQQRQEQQQQSAPWADAQLAAERPAPQHKSSTPSVAGTAATASPAAVGPSSKQNSMPRAVQQPQRQQRKGKQDARRAQPAVAPAAGGCARALDVVAMRQAAASKKLAGFCRGLHQALLNGQRNKDAAHVLSQLPMHSRSYMLQVPYSLPACLLNMDWVAASGALGRAGSSNSSKAPSHEVIRTSTGRCQRSHMRALARDELAQSEAAKWKALVSRSKKVVFQRSGVHGWGLFAAEHIAADEFVIEYIGELIRPVLSDVREKMYESQGNFSSYLFRIDKDWVADATMIGGLARFINHSCDPNCHTKIFTVDGVSRIGIYALKNVTAGEELAYDYKFEYEDDSHKVRCACGAKNCRGFMN